ncbi:hypothetical protein CPARA_3gp458 (nucleomorph) [Cryptomonas paramecium]|uniref:Uncharacterized protein n=1 Tax=Cryptomonas paramaecium TaxID=2898 RepID=F2HI53_9CRYP|nr:hypothetical protein CPARA_3gp458 [Cryptomonas paramecium]AEA39116.1 hypothetical protein CPARA_3gp458 [Cryptomonas paramecium]
MLDTLSCFINLKANLRWKIFIFKKIGLSEMTYSYLPSISKIILRKLIYSSKENIFQHKLNKIFNLSSSYMFHYLLVLFKFGLIKKYTCILILHLKLFSTVYVKLRLNSRFKQINHNQQWEKLIIKKTSFFHLFKKTVKIMIRIKKTLNFKKLKHGILINKKNFKTNYKHRIQKFWHKFWHKCFRYNLNKTFPKMKIISQKTILENFNLRFFFPRKINTFYFKKFKNRLVAFFFLRFESYIRKILIAKEKIVYNLLMFLNIFKGYINYKTLHFFLACLENFRGISKLTEQIGRQKILQFYYTKKIIHEKKTFQVSNIAEKTTQQVLKRRVMLLLWLKNSFLYVKNLGKKIAAFENKGLKRIDTKVVYRILSDLIRLGFVKIIKIYVQLYCKKIKMVEFIAERNNNILSFKKAISIFSQNIQQSICKYESEKKIFCYNNYGCLSFKIETIFFLEKKIKKTSFTSKTLCILISKMKKNIQFLKNRFFLNLCFDFQKIYVLFILGLKKTHIFNYFDLKKKINFLKNFLSTKSFLIRKRLVFNAFFYNLLQKFYQINREKMNIIITGRFFLKDRFFDLIKKSIFSSYSEVFLSEKFFMYKSEDNFKKKYSVYKWDCEIDVKIYSYFVCFFLKKNKQNNYKKLAFLKQGFYKRRIGRLKLIPNMKTIYSFFEKTIKFSKALYFRNSIKHLYQTIKRSLEFPSNYFFLNILVNKSTFFVQLTRNKFRVNCTKNVLCELNSKNIFYLIWKFFFKKIFSLCNFIFKGFLIFFYQKFIFIHLHFLIFASKDFHFLKKKEKKSSNFFLKLKKSIFFYLFFTKLFKEKKVYSVLYKDLLKKKIFLDVYNENKLTITPFFVMNRFIYVQKFQKKKEKTSMEIRIFFRNLYTSCEKKSLILVQIYTKQKKKDLNIFKKSFFLKKKKTNFLNKKTNKIIKEILCFFKNKNIFDACLNNFLEFHNYIIFWTCFDIAFCLPVGKNLGLFVFNFIFKKKFLLNQFYNEIYFLASFFSSEYLFQDMVTFQKIGFFFTSFYSFKKKITLLRYQYKINSVDITRKNSGHSLFNYFVLY